MNLGSDGLTNEEAQAEWDAQAKQLEVKTADADPQNFATGSEGNLDGQGNGEGGQDGDQTGKQGENQDETKVADPNAANVGATEDPLDAKFKEFAEKFQSQFSEQFRKINGHIGGLTSEQKRFRELLSTGATIAKEATGDAPTQTQINKAITNPEKWDALKGDFPEWADATEQFVESRLAVLKTANQGNDIQALITAEIDKVKPSLVLDAKKSAIEAIYPDWEDTVKSDEFAKWKETQPEEVLALAASDNVRDAVKMLKLYSDSVAKPAVGNTDTTGNQGTVDTTAIQEKRNKVLQDASTAPRKGDNVPPAKTVDELSAEELWAHEAALLDKKRAARGY